MASELAGAEGHVYQFRCVRGWFVRVNLGVATG